MLGLGDPVRVKEGDEIGQVSTIWLVTQLSRCVMKNISSSGRVMLSVVAVATKAYVLAFSFPLLPKPAQQGQGAALRRSAVEALDFHPAQPP